MREIASKLAEMGMEVKYFVRQDGGIRITYINGQRFTGSTGNQMARNILGATISEARVKQLQKIATPKGKWGHKKLDEVSDEIKKQIRKAQRLFKKMGTKAGMPTLRKYRAVLKQYGKQEAERRLGQAMRYSMGLAYEENVSHLAERIRMMGEEFGDGNIISLAEKIESMSYRFREKWIEVIYEWLYDAEQGRITPEELINRVSYLISQ